MARTRYLVDTTVFARLRKLAVLRAFAPLAAQRLVAVCAPVEFELRYSARDHEDYERVAEGLRAYPSVVVNDADHRRGLEVQALLSERGEHRGVSLVDALVAAAAESRGLTVLHYDRDYERIAAVTGQAHEWVVPPGSAD